MVMGLAERLKAQRNRLGLSQKIVAERLNLSPSVVSSYESGERTPSLEVLVRLASLYGCSSDYLLGISDTPPTTVADCLGLTMAQSQALITLIDLMKHG